MVIVYFGVDYDAGNTFDTKTTEPWVQTRLCVATAEGFAPRELSSNRFLRPFRYDRFDTLPTSMI